MEQNNIFKKIYQIIKNLALYIQNYFFRILILIYCFALFIPKIGIYLNDLSIGSISIGEKHSLDFTMPMLLLSIIVFNAAFSSNLKKLFQLHKYAALITFGVIANFVLGLLLFLILKGPLSLLLSQARIQEIIIAIAIITAVPLAGTATAWTQTLKGNVSLTLGMLMSTTLLSPLLAPLILKLFSYFTNPVFGNKLIFLANNGLDAFLTIIVVVPALIGLIFQVIIGTKLIKKCSHLIKFSNQLSLMLLIYANASVILPSLLSENNNPLMIIVCLFIAITFCFLTFVLGWFISVLYHFPLKDEIALIYSEGMKNIGAALVLARMGFPEYHNIGLIIIFFAITQQFFATFIKCVEHKKLLYIKNNNNRLVSFIKHYK